MRRRAFFIFAAFLLLAIVWTRPLVFHLSTRIPHDPGDPVFNTWLLWWNAHAIPFTGRWWNPPVFHPMRGALALSEHLAGISVITTPVQMAGGNPIAAYNVAFILSFALSGFFTFLLVKRLLKAAGADAFTSRAGAACAALAYGFGPYRAGQLAHLQVLTSQWMPLALLAMHAYVDDGRKRWLVWFAVAWLIQALSNGYYLLFFPVLIVLWLGWFVDWRRTTRGFVLLACWLGTSLLLAAPLAKYAAVQKGLGVGRTTAEMAFFSARTASFLHAPAMLAFAPSSPDAATTEEFLFPGGTLLLLLVGGCVVTAARRARSSGSPCVRSPFVFYAAAALLMWAFAFGPATPGSNAAAWLRPYTLLAALPGYSALRVPARFAMLAMLCAAIAAGLAFARLAPRHVRARRFFAAVAVTGLCIDGWLRPMPLAAPPGRAILPTIPHALVLELPADEGAVDVAAMYRQTQHGLPIVNGYSGHTPPHYRIFSLALRRGDPSVIREIAAGRPVVISVNQAFDRGGGIRRLVEDLPGIDARGGTSGGAMFVLPASPVRRVAPEGRQWPAADQESGAGAIAIDMGRPRTVRTVGFSVRWHYGELATRITIEASMDAMNWSPIWEDWTGAPAVAAALVDPVLVPVRLTVPDVQARYLRVHPAPSWMRGQLAAYGPG